MVLNFGPQHPSTHGVFRVKLYLDGEVIIKAVPYAGYLHRGVEKLCEKLMFTQITPIVDKNDYVSPMMNEQAINMAFEALLDVEVPRRARYLRTHPRRAAARGVPSALARHLRHGPGRGAWAAAPSLFMHCFRERESILALFEDVTGCRFHYNTHTVGGNRHDITPGLRRRSEDDDRTSSRAHRRSTTRCSARTASIVTAPRAWACSTGSRAGARHYRAPCRAPRASTTICGATRRITLRRDRGERLHRESAGTATRGRWCACARCARASASCASMIDAVPEGPINGHKPIKSPAQDRVQRPDLRRSRVASRRARHLCHRRRRQQGREPLPAQDPPAQPARRVVLALRASGPHGE